MSTPKHANSRECHEAKQEKDTQSPFDWSWVEAEVWTERMLTALENGVKGGKWFSLIDKVHSRRTLESAWHKVESNRGAAGVDGVSITRFARHADRYLEELSEALRLGRFDPSAVRRVHIPKPGGRTRPLGIPAVKDRIVQTALKMVLEPIFEREFLASSYGFRPGRGCKDALREIDGLLKEGFTWVVDADLQEYFDSIPHDSMLARVEEKVSDGRVLSLLHRFITADILDGLERWTPTMGTPQGAVISPLLANLYLHPLDVVVAESGFRMVRYADDFVILCRNEDDAHLALDLVRQWVADNGLRLHPDKTHVGDCSQAGQGFEFLGYRFEAGRRYVRKKSLQKMRDRIREKTRRNGGRSLRATIESLNPSLRGWFAYFQHADPYTFSSLDGFVRRRLRSMARRHRRKRGGTGRALCDHLEWPNAFFAELGLFSLHEARLALASRS